ncbi:MAG: FtsQ-type POTRA domain-containing protein [Clostridia bacterium]|nr:FtsQ-type POTRA domain-containing protein [Clostridia bacterium]
MEQQNRNNKRNPSGGKPGQKNGAGGAARKPYSRSGDFSGSRGDRVRISAERRKKKKKRRDAFVITVMVLMLIAVAVVLCTTVFFKASEVIVNNQMEMYSEEIIIDASGLKPGDNMFTANLDKAASAIEKALPYIHVANVRRKWPNAFFIDAEYTDTVLAVRKGGAYIYIDADGKVLETDVAQPEETAAVVNGAFADSAVPGNPVVFTDEKALNNLMIVVAAVTENGVRNVTGYDISNPTDITIEIDRRIEVKLGSVSTVAGKMEFGKEVIAKNTVEGATDRLVIDLTANAKAFVREKEETTVPVTVPVSGEEDYGGDEAEPGDENGVAGEADTAGDEGEEAGSEYEEEDGYDEYDGGYDEYDEEYDEAYDDEG